jgi:hypothetical protein
MTAPAASAAEQIQQLGTPVTTAIVTPLPPHLTQTGGNAQLIADEYLYAITDAITNAPRNLQRSIGPSEAGHICNRRIGYRLLNHPERDTPPAWKATIGTSTHMWLEGAFDTYNLNNAHLLDGQERFYIETKVSVGDINGTEITGSCDLYDRVTHTVIDHKTCGPTQLANYKRNGPGQQYRVQAHLYGRGWQRAGLHVETVMIAFLPRNGELADAYIWHEPYNEQVAVDALQRLAGIDLAVQALGPAALPHLATANYYCNYCPYFSHKSTDLTGGCPGDPESNANKPQPANDQEFLGL